jgi:hypothetical protein
MSWEKLDEAVAQRQVGRGSIFAIATQSGKVYYPVHLEFDHQKDEYWPTLTLPNGKNLSMFGDDEPTHFWEGDFSLEFFLGPPHPNARTDYEDFWEFYDSKRGRQAMKCLAQAFGDRWGLKRGR